MRHGCLVVGDGVSTITSDSFVKGDNQAPTGYAADKPAGLLDPILGRSELELHLARVKSSSSGVDIIVLPEISTRVGLNRSGNPLVRNGNCDRAHRRCGLLGIGGGIGVEANGVPTCDREVKRYLTWGCCAQRVGGPMTLLSHLFPVPVPVPEQAHR